MITQVILLYNTDYQYYYDNKKRKGSIILLMNDRAF